MSQDTGLNRQRWNQHLEALHTYLAREGHSRVPATHTETITRSGTHETVALGTWVSYARQRYRAGKLSPARIADLTGLPGWEWGPLRPGPSADELRNAEIMAMRQNKASLREIGDAFGLSRQRVHQIVGRAEARA
jgi:hypothetical protein